MDSTTKIAMRRPRMEDGARIWQLVKDTNVLDVNSAYSYLMMCMLFPDTCVVAEEEGTGELIGFVNAFRPPAEPDSIFIWQIGVAASGRGKGLGGALLQTLLQRETLTGVSYVTATISPSNIPSKKLFQSLARMLDAELTMSEEQGIPEHVFPGGDHESEPMYRIGPVQLPIGK